MSLLLGPVVGHTDESSSRIWIQAPDDPGDYQLRVQGVGLFDFLSTEAQLEFGTGMAVAEGLRPDRVYRYAVLCRGRVVRDGRGTFRTMPEPSSAASILFCAISCNATEHDGVWAEFAAYVEKAKPAFVLMMGDQVYIDEDEPDVFKHHFKSPPAIRRRALAEKYRLNWSRKPVRQVLANVPTYMMWDDHDIRDGWGSVAADSETLADRYPRGREIYRNSNAYFEDARDVYWHFQGCHNPMPAPGQLLPNYVTGPPPPGARGAMPFAFRCGRVVVIVLDSRGDRDAFRKSVPVLGAQQWSFLDQVFAGLAREVEALVVVTPTPIASMDPNGQVQNLLGDRTDDVVAFRKGDEGGTLKPAASSKKRDAPLSIVNVHASRMLGTQLNWGTYMVNNVDEARDQWSHKFARAEQEDLIRKAGTARVTNVIPGAARRLLFLSGDIHVGCIFDITCSKPEFEAVSLTSSGISASERELVVLSTYLDESFTVAPGIRSKLREVVNDFNFGVVQVVRTGMGAELTTTLAHKGNAAAVGVDAASLVR